MKKIRQTLLMSLALLLGLGTPNFSSASDNADNFPTKSITIINPFAAGGGSDFICRVIADSLQRNLGQTVNVVSVPGGAGATGMNQVKRAKPDGYTIILSALGPAEITPNRAKVGYNTVDDFKAIAKITSSEYVIAVNSKSDIRTFNDLLEKGKTDKTMTYGTPRAGLGQHLMFSDLLNRIPDVSMQHIPFNGSTEMVSAILGEHVNVIVGVDTDLLPHVLSGDLRVIATAGTGDSGLFPEPVPTLQELGYSTALGGMWNGFLAPAATPDTIVTKLESAIFDALNEPEVKERFAKAKTHLDYEDSKTFAERIKTEYATFKELITQLL